MAASQRPTGLCPACRVIGDVAQLGEHRLCKAGVEGSSPFVSTASGYWLRQETIGLGVDVDNFGRPTVIPTNEEPMSKKKSKKEKKSEKAKKEPKSFPGIRKEYGDQLADHLASVQPDAPLEEVVAARDVEKESRVLTVQSLEFRMAFDDRLQHLTADEIRDLSGKELKALLKDKS